MSKLFFILCLFGSIQVCLAQPLIPLQKNIGKLTVSIDPRMEALSVIQVLSAYRPILRNNAYAKKILDYFKGADSLKAVQLTNQCKDYFSYDAPVTFMLYLSQPDELKQQQPYPSYLIERAGGRQNLEEYRLAIREFIQKSGFKEFWHQNTELYQQILEKTVDACQDIDWIKALEEYYNETQNSYHILISPCFIGGYGPRIGTMDSKQDIYACIKTTAYSDRGIPYVDNKGLIYYVWHEFSHSYVNPVFEKYGKKVNASQKLFKPLKEVMSKQAYNQWDVCVNEHMVRAVNLRLIDLYMGNTAYLQKLNEELSRGFLYIEPILHKLTEFEKLKTTSQITFSQFVPELIGVLDSLAHINYQKQLNYTFKGPINSVGNNEKTAVIYPTNIKDSLIRKGVQAYVVEIYEKFFNAPSNLLLADTTALRQSLADYAIIAYGSLSGNLFLNRYKSIFPFSMNEHELIADQVYTQPGIRIISCFPNPQNKTLGMTLYSAPSDKDVIGINSVFHGPEDYVISSGRKNILKNGYYFNKLYTGWTFQE